MSMNRRHFLVSAASAATLGVLGTSSASATVAPERPDHIVQVRDNLEELERYQPKLVLGLDARSDITGMYGWIAESAQHDVTAYYYWTRYATQRSLLYWAGIDWGPDEHYLDHEPSIVFVNPDGTVDRIIATGGHHYAIEIDASDAVLEEGRVDGLGTHVVLRVVRPHNHYMNARESDVGQFIQPYAEFGSFEDVRHDWHRNGRFNQTNDEALVDPFAFYDHDLHYWWREDTWDAQFARYVWIPLGLRRGSSRDTLLYEQ